MCHCYNTPARSTSATCSHDKSNYIFKLRYTILSPFFHFFFFFFIFSSSFFHFFIVFSTLFPSFHRAMVAEAKPSLSNDGQTFSIFSFPSTLFFIFQFPRSTAAAFFFRAILFNFFVLRYFLKKIPVFRFFDTVKL